MIDEEQVDVERFIGETMRDLGEPKYIVVPEQERSLVTLLYHLNILPEYIRTTFDYRHEFQACLYSKDDTLRHKSAIVYSKLLRGTLEQAEAVKNYENPLMRHYRFDDMRKMIYEDVVHGSILAPLLRAAIGLLLEQEQKDHIP